MVQALKPVYQADDAATAEQALGAFEGGEWGRRFVVQSWQRHWDRIRSSLSPRPDRVHDEIESLLDSGWGTN